MILKLSAKHRNQILEFAYKREKENLFVIGNFSLGKNPFDSCEYYGYFRNGKLAGLAMYSKLWKSFMVNAPTRTMIEALVDFGFKRGIKIKTIPAFKKYADSMVERLKKTHGLKPKEVSDKKVLVLKKSNFRNFAKGMEEKGGKGDIDGLIRVGRWIDHEESGKVDRPIVAEERKRVDPSTNTILRINEKIVSKANIHGLSKNYFQIGGVGTLPEYRSKGYAKQVVSALCRNYFEKGLKYGLLFTDKDNVPALKVYRKLGFKPVGDYTIVTY